MKKAMKIMIGCGGTGGHIFPALAIADTIKENCSGAEISFVGGERGMEKNLVPSAGYSIELLPLRGIKRSLTIGNFKALAEMRAAIKTVKRRIEDLSPDLVIGTGGYACYPALRAAADLGIPTAVHESNAVPGLAVKRLASRMDRVWVNFAETARLLHRDNVRVVGNPIRIGRCVAQAASKNGCLHVLSFGGSLGADEINRAVLELMISEKQCEKIRHLHATGKARYEAVENEFLQKGLGVDPRFRITPFIEDMPSQLAQADLVIARAGAMTVSELALLGKAAILIPSPNVTGNHQYKNARVLADAGAACLLEERFLKTGALTDVAMALLQDDARRAALSQAITAFATPNANRLILEDIVRLVKK